MYERNTDFELAVLNNSSTDYNCNVNPFQVFFKNIVHKISNTLFFMIILFTSIYIYIFRIYSGWDLKQKIRAYLYATSFQEFHKFCKR